MKKVMTGCILTAIILCFSGCGKNTSPQELRKLGLDPQSGQTSVRILSKKSFYGDDLLKLVVKFPEGLTEQLEGDPSWSPFPMDEATSSWITQELDGIASPAAKIRSGYYTLQGGNPADPESFLRNGHYHFIAAIYDNDNHVMYYCEVNT